jgi:hypothetical protein
MDNIKTLYKYGFILVQPLSEYFVNGGSVFQKRQPRLINTAHIVDIIIGRTECLITLTGGASINVDKDELLNELRLL